MLFVPNVLWVKCKPLGYEEYVKNERKILQAFERIGQILVCVCVMAFSDFNIRMSPWIVWLIAHFCLWFCMKYIGLDILEVPIL